MTVLSSPSLLLRVSLFAVRFQWCIDLFSKELHLAGVGESFSICRKIQHKFKWAQDACIWFLCQTYKSLYFSMAQAPGLKRTMARRQPSSVLSICISLILLTSSVRTLKDDRFWQFKTEWHWKRQTFLLEKWKITCQIWRQPLHSAHSHCWKKSHLLKHWHMKH